MKTENKSADKQLTAKKTATKNVAKPVLSATKKSTEKSATGVSSVQTVPKIKNDTQAEQKVENTMNSKRIAGPGPMDFSPYKEVNGEEYMNKNQLDHFRGILDLWKDQLHADRDATVQHMQDDAINFPDILDRAALEEEHKLEWQAREREHKLINKIDLALSRIKQGDYGYCDVCGAEIGIRRLEARPTATQCIDCKTIDEIREKQTGIVE